MASQGSQQMDISKEVKEESSIGSTNTISTADEATMSSTSPIYRKLLEFTDSAADELYEMATSASPLWGFDQLLGVELLNKEAYRNRFMTINQRHGELAQPLTSEASRARGTVHMNPDELVKMFMDVDQWLAMFPNIVSTAAIVRKITTDGNPDGSLLVMSTELGLPTPYTVTRAFNFVRRVKKLNESKWLIVDVSLDTGSLKCYRKPSGSLIEQEDDGGSKVTWVEHIELMPEGSQPPALFKEHLVSGFAFHAMRWIMMLKHQGEIKHMIDQHINGGDDAKSRLLRLAHRMTQMCIKKMNTSNEKTWDLMTKMGYAGIDIFVTSEQYENNPGRPDGTITTAAASIPYPSFSPDNLYDTLRCAGCRPKWDVSILGASSTEEVNIAVGKDSSAYISLLNIEIPGMDEPVKLLQSCFTDSNGMYVVWTNLKRETMDVFMEGGDDPDGVGILVSGVAVLPSDPTVEGGGSTLTVTFETLETKGDSVQQDEVKSTISKTISMVTELCTSPNEDCGRDQ